MEKTQKYCSFCGRDEVNTKHLVAGADTYICDICINNAMELLNLDDNISQMDILKNLKTVTPKKLKTEFSKVNVSDKVAKIKLTETVNLIDNITTSKVINENQILSILRY